MSDMTRSLITSHWPHIQGCRALLLLRHAERPALPGNFGLDVQITPQGTDDARKCGAFLASLPGVKPGKFFSSPYTRCVQTVKAILDGSGWSTREPKPEIRQCYQLTGRGLTWTDGDKAENAVFSHKGGVLGLINDILAGNSPEGCQNFPESGRLFSAFFHHILDSSEPETFSLACSHDSEISQLIAWNFGLKKFDRDSWPKFLEPVVFWRNVEEGRSYCAWRDRKVSMGVDGFFAR